MKIGLLMVITAVSLFTGTVVWSTVTPVERKRNDSKFTKEFPSPDRVTDHSWFFHSESAFSFLVDAPVNVEIDDSFTGVELRGDTNAFKYLNIWLNNNSLISGRMDITRRAAGADVARDSSPDAVQRYSERFDSVYYNILKSSNITLRIGTASDMKKGNDRKKFVFHHCKKVISLSPVTGQSLFIESNSADSMLLALDVRYLDVDINDHTYSKYVLFKGKAERAHYKLSDTELDAQELISNESYIYMSYKSAINIHATEIVNARHLSNCELNISGNPKYKRISESE